MSALLTLNRSASMTIKQEPDDNRRVMSRYDLTVSSAVGSVRFDIVHVRNWGPKIVSS